MQAGQQSTLTGAINVLVLAQIARAAITLPKISIITSPVGTTTTSAVVNTPTYVAVSTPGTWTRRRPTTDDGDFGMAPICGERAGDEHQRDGLGERRRPAMTGFGDPGQTAPP